MFAPKTALTENDVQKGLSLIIRDGLASQLLVTLTGGAFMIAFALKLGASNVLIGALAAVGPLTNLIQLPAVVLVEKFRRRKAIVFTAALVSRAMWVAIAAIPFLFTSGGVGLFLGALVLNGILAAVAGTAWNSWMRDLIPQKGMGGFFSRRMRIAIGVSIPVNLAAALFIDWWKKTAGDIEIYGYSGLFVAGFLIGLVGLFFISRIPEPAMPAPDGKGGLLGKLAQPFRDFNFRNLLFFFGSWHFAVNLAAPFFTVYMLRRLEFGLTQIIGLSILSQLTSVVFLKIWGSFTDRFSSKSVLSVCGPLFMFCILGWTFTTMPDKYFLTVPLVIVLHVFMGIATSGVNLAAGNISLKLAPAGQATSYMAVNSLINSAAAGSAPILGGKFADFFTTRQLALDLRWISPVRELHIPTINIQQWDFFFLFAFIIGLYSIHRLAAVREEGEVGQDVVVKELKSEIWKTMRGFTPAPDIRSMMHIPAGVVRSTMEMTTGTLKKTGDLAADTIKATGKFTARTIRKTGRKMGLGDDDETS